LIGPFEVLLEGRSRGNRERIELGEVILAADFRFYGESVYVAEVDFGFFE
jgi:hypothetical protein